MSEEMEMPALGRDLHWGNEELSGIAAGNYLSVGPSARGQHA